MHSCSNSIRKFPLFLVANNRDEKFFFFVSFRRNLKFVIKHVKSMGKYFYKFFFFLLSRISLSSTSFVTFHCRHEVKIDWNFFANFGFYGQWINQKKNFARKKTESWCVEIFTCFKKSSNRLFKLVSAVSWGSRQRFALNSSRERRKKRAEKRRICCISRLIYTKKKSQLVKNRFKMNHLRLNQHLSNMCFLALFLHTQKTQIASSQKKFYFQNEFLKKNPRKINFHLTREWFFVVVFARSFRKAFNQIFKC